jgi:hypothetical protein
MTVKRMREQRLSLTEFSSWCLPVVARPLLDTGQIRPATKGSGDNGYDFDRRSQCFG